MSSDVNFPDRLIWRDDTDIRSPLLQTLVELYLQKPFHTAEEERHFTELALRLLEHSTIETRVAVASSLGSYTAAPAAILQRLAADVPAVAAAVREARPPSALRPTGPSSLRDRLSAADLSNLFFTAPAEDRRLILLNLHYAVPPEGGFEPAAAPSDAARQLEVAALSRNLDAIAGAIEQWLGIAPALASRIVHDPLGEPIVAVAKVLDVPADAVQRILLFLNPAIARSVRLVYELATLFEEIERDAACLLVDIWRGAEPRSSQASAAASAREPIVRPRRELSASSARSLRRTLSAPLPSHAAGRR